MLAKLPLDTSCIPILGSRRASLNATGPPPPLEKLELITRDNNNNRKQRALNGGGFKKGFTEIHRQKPNNGVGLLEKKGFEKNPVERKGLGDLGSDGFDERNENFEVKKLQTKCSTKWLSYGGCIPAMLTAVEEVEDLDKALKPWEERLSNKERSIILKEQMSWVRALEVFEWFKRQKCYEAHVIHYNIVLRILGKARKWRHLRSVWDEMNEERVEPINSTYGTLIDVYSKGGFEKEALVWLQRMAKQGLKPDEVTMVIVLQLYKKTGEYRKAEEFFEKWSDGALHSHGSLSSHTYNTLIDTHGKAGRVKEASEIFALMLREGIAPTTVTFNTMIHICGTHGQLSEVDSLMQKMEDGRCPPDTRTYNILISLHARHDNIDVATYYFAKMKEVCLEPDLVSYRTLLYAYSLRHMISKAEELVTEMDERGLEIDEFAHSALTRMYIESGMLEKSWAWFMRFHLSGKMGSNCYAANIDAYGERGHILEAEKVLNCCREVKKLRVLEFNVMIKAYGVGKHYRRACKLFDSMESHGVIPDRCSYSSLIQILASGDMPHAAVPYLKKMHESRLVHDCIPFCAVISSFVKLGQLEKAEEVYNQLVGFDVQPDVIVFGVLINAFAEVGSVKKALSYADAMIKAGFAGNTVIYNTLIKLYTKVGLLKEAEEIYKLLQSSEDGSSIYASNCMIDLYSERCMVKAAENLFDCLKSKGDANEFTYAMMLCMYKRMGRFEEAIQIAKQMRELRLLTDALSYNNVIGLYATYGRFKEVVGTFKEMMKAGIEPDGCTFKSLGLVLVKSGLSKQAVGKLEVSAKKDAHSGLQAWMSALSAVVRVNESSYR